MEARCSRCKGGIAPDAERCPHCGAWFGPNRNAETVLKMIGLVLLLVAAARIAATLAG